MTEGDLGGEAELMYAYGTYLLSGGSPDAFWDLTLDDIQLIVATDAGRRANLVRSIARVIARILGAEERR